LSEKVEVLVGGCAGKRISLCYREQQSLLPPGACLVTRSPSVPVSWLPRVAAVISTIAYGPIEPPSFADSWF